VDAFQNLVAASFTVILDSLLRRFSHGHNLPKKLCPNTKAIALPNSETGSKKILFVY